MDSSAANPGEKQRRASLIRRVGLLAGIRIRRKLIVLHTLFSLALALILLIALRPAINEVVRQAEAHEAGLVLSEVLASRASGPTGPVGGASEHADQPLTRPLQHADQASPSIRYGTPDAVGIDTAAAEQARTQPGQVTYMPPTGPPVVAVYEPATGQYIGASVTLETARNAVVRLYITMMVALLAVYALVAAALEIFVLPQHVYRPIRTMLEADLAVREGRQGEELIAPAAMPADELGQIMRSRNESISALRRHERELAAALSKLEEVANDLKRKNHLLEMAKRNLADADRLASLGMMSAGIAHELNTPLAVLKGLVEKLQTGSPGTGADELSPEEAALMLRVVGRLERLSESLLDFARVRPPKSAPSPLRPLVEEAWTLVRLDRVAASVEFDVAMPDELTAMCDAPRMVQVFVNLLRNAVDAMDEESNPVRAGRVRAISVAGALVLRDGAPWVTLTVADSGPGIDPAIFSRLFEPFASTRLDANGTGLGLAVAEGIVREHGGVILARNRVDGPGAIFEIMLPEGSLPESSRAGPSPVDSATAAAGRSR